MSAKTGRDSNLRRQKKREVVQVLVILVLKGGGSGAFCLKICDVLAQQDEFSINIVITSGRL